MFNICCLVHKVENNLEILPQAINTLFSQNSQVHDYDTRQKEELHPNNINPSFKPFGIPTPFTKGGRSNRPTSYVKNRCPHEREILQGIRDTFESLRNVKVVYIVFTWLP